MKPILFNTEMVRAILEGRKTVTRRIAKFIKREESLNVDLYASACELDVCNRNAYCIYRRIHGCWNEVTKPLKPKYKIGDILYVRETWAEWTGGYCYKTNCDYPLSFTKKWKPSIHMPKEAARLFLKVKDVRIERLQDITEEQAVKEGSKSISTPLAKGKGRSYVQGFAELWNSTIRKDELNQQGWNANPYVFVYDYEVISKDEAYARD